MDDSRILLDMILKLKQLTTITISQYILTEAMLTTLGRLPKLQAIRLMTDFDENTHSDGIGDDLRPRYLYEPAMPGSFPSLRDLSLPAKIVDAKRFLVGGPVLRRLKGLYIWCDWIEAHEVVQDLLAELVKHYPDLSEFAMDILMDCDNARAEDCQPLTFNEIRPLLSLRNSLTSITMLHNQPVMMSKADYVTLGKALPNLSTLVLSCEPTMGGPPTLGLDILLVIAENFPKLRRLGIFLDALTTEGFRSLPRALPLRSQFKLLESVNFGCSPITSELMPVQLFLSHLFSDAEREPAVEAGLTTDGSLYAHEETWAHKVQVYCSRWEEVNRVLPVLVRARREEKRQHKELLREVEDLRMRDEVLAGWAQTGTTSELMLPCVAM
jgi:hypothetical protein